MHSEFHFTPIAYFRCGKKQTLETSSQGTLDPLAQGTINLSGLPQWKEMLEDLEGFSHLWILSVFHLNQKQWKPKVWPPRFHRKVGLFASRSPHRPAPIGLTAVRLEKIEGPKIFVSGHDLLDETPILDLKPYLVYADCFPEAQSGWTNQIIEWTVLETPEVQVQIDFLEGAGLSELRATLRQQLRFNPTDHRRKRVRPMGHPIEGKMAHFIFSYRTWRVFFTLENTTITLYSIDSGYSSSELAEQTDSLGDKELHRNFLYHFHLVRNLS